MKVKKRNTTYETISVVGNYWDVFSRRDGNPLFRITFLKIIAKWSDDLKKGMLYFEADGYNYAKNGKIRANAAKDRFGGIIGGYLEAEITELVKLHGSEKMNELLKPEVFEIY